MVKVSDLFDIVRGSCSCIEDYSQGDTPLVSASMAKNGVVGFIAKQAGERTFSKVPCLSVPVIGDGTCCAVVQAQEFHATVNVEVLIPKDDLPFWNSNKDAKLIAAAAAIRANRWRFSYGRTAGGRLGNVDIDDQQIARVSNTIGSISPNQTQISLTTVQSVIAKLQQAYGPSIRISDVFDIKSMSGVMASGLKNAGAIPVVGADGNITNGVIGYVDALPGSPFPKETLSVAKNGSNAGVCRLHLCEWGGTGDVACLKPKLAWTVDELLVLAAVIESQEWRFFYGRKASSERLRDLSLCL